ncbi:T6SS immunity protein Tli4 family protein [Paraburkholderia sp. J63]|uniref:T6SS immunity protein Tli4 family protein n=1 Tax=Paraburkholderia sp. J63 TaxID=2805434 RepID=UPI002ABD7963|nr:T6SS immunity protein Tli4 family protein [Paraburkholderia sp. J63]
MNRRSEACALVVSTLAIALISSQVIAAPQQECVGRYRLTLPGESDIALTTVTAFHEPQAANIRFSDGVLAPLSSFIYNGTFYITDAMTRDGYNSLVDTMKDRVSASQNKPYEEQRLAALPVQDAGSYAWAGRGGAAFYTFKGGKAVSFVTKSDDKREASADALDVLMHLQARGIGVVPEDPGVCLPGLFVKSSQDDKTRIVGTTYRLKMHPDVLIFFLDSKALKNQPKLTSRQKNEFVWTSEFGVGKAVKLHGTFPWRSVKLDGREGVGSFGTITRKDDSTDYGYLVTVQGDPDATTDTPDLLLYVERNGAAANGQTPVTADEIERIGEEVAASVKRR